MILFRTPALAVLAALALVAGPAVGALCGTEAAAGHDAPVHETLAHAAPGHSPEAPPCHEALADDAPGPEEGPVRAPSHDCASVCCAADVPALPAEAPVPVQALVQAIVLVTTAPAELADARPIRREAPPPDGRRHARLQRYLI